jgi:Winged helix DNA-binding domain
MGFEGVAGSAWLLVDGVVAGIWTRKKQGKLLALDVEPFVRLSAARRRELEAEAGRVAEIAGAELALTVR